MAKSKAAAALPQSAVAVDLVVLTVRGGELCVLTVRRGIPPYQGKFALPGGFVLPDEDLEAAAYRELAEEAGRALASIPANLIRLSVGAEHPADVIDDLTAALERA